MFNGSQLEKLHRQFYHPSADKLYNLIKRARPDQVNDETRNILQEVTSTCHPCQMMARKPISFTVGSAKDNEITFNREIAMDIVYLAGKPALHIIDIDTHFQAATFLRSMSTDDVWDAILRSWANVYAGFPEHALTDQGSQLVSPRFKELALHFGINFRYVPIESHNSNGLIERYHGPLRRTFEKVRMEYRGISDELALSCAVRAANQTLGPEGIVPVTLVLGIVPRIGTKLPNQPERVRAMLTACEEMRTILAKSKVNRALRRAVTPAADSIYTSGDEVLVFRENPAGFTGPFKVASVLDKTVYIQYPDGTIRPFSCAQLKHYRSAATSTAEGTRFLKHVTENISKNSYSTNITEIIDKKDPRTHDPRMEAAKRKEIQGLLKRGTFKVILKSEIPDGANVLGGRYVLSIKDTGTNREVWKSRYVIQGHRDQEKEIMVRSSTNIQQRSLRIVFALSGILGFKIWTQDVTQAYLQSAGTLARDVFINKPAPELGLNSEQALKLLRPLYGLADSGDFWYRELSQYHRELGMKPLTTDSSLWMKFTNNVLEGLSAIYVDDVVQVGTNEFDRLTDSLSESYDAKAKEYGDGRIAGIEFFCDADGVKVNQAQYLHSLKVLPTDASYEDFRSARMKLAWLVHSRPDVSYCAATAAQVTPDLFQASTNAIRRLNSSIKRLHESPNEALRFPILDISSLRICVYCDASFANNDDMSSQMGYIVFLTDGNNRCAPLSYKSVKCKRVTRSVLAAEAIAFAEGFDQGFTIKNDLHELLGIYVPLTILTDSKTLFDVITKASYTREKRILIDLSCVREGYRRFDIDDIGLIASAENLADGFTKETNMDKLCIAVRTGKLNTLVKQFVIRKQSEQPDGI
jgi:Reverse transcriptase (RNA-dependent DNA polymerase)